MSLTPGLYSSEDAERGEDTGQKTLIEIATDGVELDLGGSVLDGLTREGVGIMVRDCEGVTIRNGTVKGFHYGIRAENVRKLVVTNCVISDNHNPLGIGWLDDTIDPVEEGFGGGLYLRGVSEALIDGNHLNNNFNGIDLVRSDGNTIRGNDTSYSGNVGIHLLRSSHNAVERNRADHCIRYTDRFRHDTADSAGILLEEYSHHNRIIDNSMRYSGDGFFIRANNRHGSDHNHIARNDGSFSPNNAFEAGFSAHNAFEDNVASYSNYGFWLGYSSHTTLRGNEVRSNRLDGIAIEDGGDNRVEGNDIIGNRSGVRIRQEPTAPEGYRREPHVVRANRIRGSREFGVLYSVHSPAVVEDNAYEDNGEDVKVSAE